jgi:hypothetical protein
MYLNKFIINNILTYKINAADVTAGAIAPLP